ncbi:MAG: prolipoprotein diacylglyceryl transferase family protein [Patescibacteria group bacterium]
MPTFFVFSGYKIHTIGIFLTLAFFMSLFVLWQEGRKDGFGEEKLFDLFVVSLFSSLVFSRVFYAFDNRLGFYGTYYNVIRFWTPGFSSLGALIGFITPVVILSRKWKWSLFRILDIFSLSFLLGLSLISLSLIAYYKQFAFLFLFSGYLFAFAGLSFLRRKSISGLVFPIFALTNIIIGMLVFPGRVSLIFYACLFTISLLNFLIRMNKHMDKKEKSLDNILKIFKGNLLAKNKQLEARQQKLIEEDPYLQDGRSEGNSEAMDDAVLEDTPKELTDIKKASLAPVIMQVRKALARMKIGKYGICEVCGGPIEEGRLEIYPEATTCSSCSNKKKK